jgi:hypothetical protein
MLEAARTSETSVNFYTLYGTASEKIDIFILFAMGT